MGDGIIKKLEIRMMIRYDLWFELNAFVSECVSVCVDRVSNALFAVLLFWLYVCLDCMLDAPQ